MQYKTAHIMPFFTATFFPYTTYTISIQIQSPNHFSPPMGNAIALHYPTNTHHILPIYYTAPSHNPCIFKNSNTMLLLILVKKPIGLYRSDGKRPDGCSIAPWTSGQCLVWDFTCVDTFAASYIADATREARAVATAAEARKKEKYVLLSKSHHFVPIAIETSGALGPDALSLLTDISRRQQSITNDHKSLSFLLQRVSIALQHSNAASVLGTTISV